MKKNTDYQAASHQESKLDMKIPMSTPVLLYCHVAIVYHFDQICLDIPQHRFIAENY